MDKIITYLNSASPDFDEGYALLSLRLKNEILLKNILRKRNQSKLIYELTKIATRKTALTVQPTPVNYTQKSFDKSDLVNAPREVQLLYDEAMALYADQRGIHAQMRVADSDNKRAGFRSHLIACDNRRREIYELLDNWVRTGNIPSMPQVDNTPVVSAKDINSAAAGLTRNLALAEKTPQDNKRYSIYVERVRANYNILLLSGRKFGDRVLTALKKLGIVD